MVVIANKSGRSPIEVGWKATTESLNSVYYQATALPRSSKPAH